MNSATNNRGCISRGHRRAVSVTLAAIMLATMMVAFQSAQAQIFNAPGAGTGPHEGTDSLSINSAGTVTGFYVAAGTFHGFVRTASGTITEFNIPGAGTGNNEGTYPFSINASGKVAGMYSVAGSGIYGVYRGFILAAPYTGSATTIEIPGAYQGGNLGTAVSSINTAGAVTGMYRDTSLRYHGFVRTSTGTMIYPIDAPGAGTGTYQGTKPLGINTAGTITGYYTDSSNVAHGFFLAAPYTAVPTSFDVSGAAGTTPISINPAGTITGVYSDSSNVSHGFVRSVAGVFTTFSAPGAAPNAWLAALLPKALSLQGTGGFNINTAGMIVGTYTDTSNEQHGYVRAATTGNLITTFSIPGAAGGLPVGGTGGFSINTAGVVTGAYTDSSAVAHGFVLTPTTTTITSSPNPSTSGQTVTFTAKVTSTLGVPPNGETVSFMKGTTVLGTGTLASGSASFASSSLPVGTTSVTAVYRNDSELLGSISKAEKQVVNKATN